MPLKYKPIPDLTPQQIVEFYSNTKREGECLVWTGDTVKEYGLVTIEGQNYIASRVAYAIVEGSCPVDKLICHHCDNPPCIEYSHLFVGTHKDNAIDAVAKGRIAHGDNHYYRKNPTVVRKGEKHCLAKLTEKDIITLRELVNLGSKDKAIYEFFNGRISRSHIGSIRRGTFWKDITI